MEDAAKIRDQADKIVQSGALGRSRSYRRLLEYLVDCSARGHAPKEIEIASDVFGKGADFDSSQDSMVRVYAHNLRQKLDLYYSGDGADAAERLALPKGEYRVTLQQREAETTEPATAPRRGPRLIAAAAVLLIAGFAVGLAVGDRNASPQTRYDEIAATPVWASVLDDDLPILIVVGDYYIFGELDQRGDVERLVREFSINSSRDLDELMMLQPELADRYMDLDLTYLARSTAFALRDVLRVLYTSDKPVRVVSMSDFNVADMKSNHIVYIGYLSALDKLMDFVFAGSGLAIGDSFDELWKPGTGEVFLSEAGLPSFHRNYRDYGLYSTFPGPEGNQIIVIAGMRDTGLMQTAQTVTSDTFLASAEQALPGAIGPDAPSFEMLYEVTGFDRTNLDAMLVHAQELDQTVIWSGESSPYD